MFVEITDGGAQVREAENLKGLAVHAPDAASLAAIGALGEVDADGQHVWLHITAFREAAAATVDAGGRDEWLAGFDGMIAYAIQKGWTDEAGTKVRAHVEFTAG